MKVGDNVAKISNLGTIVGVDTDGNPIVQTRSRYEFDDQTYYFESVPVDNLIVVDLTPADDDLIPEREAGEIVTEDDLNDW